MNILTVRVRARSIAMLLACSGAPVVSVTAQGDLPAKPPPAIVKDVNAVADGHHVDPATDSTGYPLTDSSYPDTPKVVGSRLYFLANDGAGRRLLYRYDPASTGALITDVNVTGLASVPNPKNLTVSDDGTKLYFTASGIPESGGTFLEKVLTIASDTTVTTIAFKDDPKYVRIDGLVAISGSLAVLAVTAAAASGSGAKQALWIPATSGKLETAAETTAGYYSNTGQLVQVTGTGTGYPFYAFSGKPLTSGAARCLVVITGAAFREVAVPNPALLTPFGPGLMLVDMAPYGSTADTVRYLGNPTATVAVVVQTGDGIRNLTVGGTAADPMLLFTTGVGTETPLLRAYYPGAGGYLPALDTGEELASVTSLAKVGDVVYVLGTKAAGSNVTTVWQFDPATAVLNQVKDFSTLASAGSLTAFVQGSVTRLAFLATRSGTGLPVPVISTRSSGGVWSTEDIPMVSPGSMPELLTRVGDYVFFRATHVDRGCEPWSWQHN